uniref:Uncharacterized protein n=1 Tax=Setaria italica TaxID=4555 RepID=K3ZFL8_SETIT
MAEEADPEQAARLFSISIELKRTREDDDTGGPRQRRRGGEDGGVGSASTSRK